MNACGPWARASIASMTDTPSVVPVSLPTGARDVLPVEAGQLRAVESTLRGVFHRYGYREVRTPLMEFAEVIDRAQEGGPDDVFRLFDEAGRVLVLRPDLTIPMARLISTRMADHPGPVRVAYTGAAFRTPQHGRPRAVEQWQAGVELVGQNGPGADAEIIAMLVDALAAAGLSDFRVGIGDVRLTREVLDALGVDGEPRADLAKAASERNFVAWRRVAQDLALPEVQRALVAALPTLRGGVDALARIVDVAPAAREACDYVREVLDLVRRAGVADDAVLLDLGVSRDWTYYSGLVLEAYSGKEGTPIAFGGRYDGLFGRFGNPRTAVGFAVFLNPLNRALAANMGDVSAMAAGVVLVGGLDTELDAANALRRVGVPVVALAAADARAETVAEADGWRFVARPGTGGYAVRDRSTGEDFSCLRLEEAIPSRV
jgi:ATP phosphoribosyltransferase regulatory subunit